MPLIAFLPIALYWVFRCVLVAIVAGAAAGSRTTHWKRGLVGALVGAAFGIITIGALFSDVRSMTFFLNSPLPAPPGGLDPYFTRILLSIAAGALVGLAVALLEVRSVPVVRRCIIVGVLFGVILSLANIVVGSIVSFALPPAILGDSFLSISISVVVFGLVPMIIRVAVDVALTVVAFRFVRRTWGAAPPAS